MEIVADSEEEQTEDTSGRNWEKKMGGNKVLQLKGNIIPRGLVPLERLFDKNDVPLQSGKVVEENQVEDLNLGTEADPKIVRLSKKVPEEYKNYIRYYFSLTRMCLHGPIRT